jgi:uncharacterized membrane protein YdbT with pleckstrin-like domain
MAVKLRDMEHIDAVFRQSKWVLIHPILANLVTVALPWYFILRYEIGGWIPTVLMLWSVIVALHLARELFLWYMNTYIVTNQRLLHWDQTSIFNRTVIETPHERILNVSYKTKGVLSSFLGYGNVEVQVVGLMEPMIMKNVAHPQEVKDYLWQMHGRVTNNKNTFDSEDIEHIQERVGYTKKNQRIL